MVEEAQHHFHLRTSGTLTMGEPKTLESLEAFCAEARRLGVNGQEPLRPFKQTLLGPVVSWHFNIPVIVQNQAKETHE